MRSPSASDDVAAGDGALRTCRVASASERTKSSTSAPSQGVSSFDHLVTQWMSRIWWVFGRALNSAQFHLATGFGPTFYHLLLLMVLSSAAASTQTTILPTARTTLSMAAYKALPKSFATVHPRFMTPTVSTIAMGLISIAVYVGLNYSSNGIGVIGDAVIAIGLYIAFYYGLTGFACAWYYRKNLTSSARNLWMQGILPATGGLILYFLGGWSVWLDYDVATENDYTMWTVPGIHWQIGGAFVIAVVSLLVGILFFLYCRYIRPGAPFSTMKQDMPA